MKKILKSFALMAGISFIAVNANAQLASESAAPTARTAATQTKTVAVAEVQTASSSPVSSAPVQAIIKSTDAADKTKPAALVSDPQQAPGTEPAPVPAIKAQPALVSDPQQRPGGR